MNEKKYKLSIDPRILELLGPNLYTNIYYVLAELIANAYDADAHNVYIISNPDNITVEDDGSGMSYEEGDVNKFLNVAGISSNNKAIITNLKYFPTLVIFTNGVVLTGLLLLSVSKFSSDIRITLIPHIGQNFTLSASFTPQFWQYIIYLSVKIHLKLNNSSATVKFLNNYIHRNHC